MNVPSNRAISRATVFFAALILALSPAAEAAQARSAAPAISITVSMEPPTSHYYHIVIRAEGLRGGTQDFKMPVWTPGYYRIMDCAKSVKGFRAEGGEGRALPFEKTAKNCRRVRTGEASSIVVSYDVYAQTVETWDYAKYLGYAGLAIDLEPRPVPGPWFGASTQDQNGNVLVTIVEPDSPAASAGLSAQDEILAVDGTRVTQRTLTGALDAHEPGDKVKVLYARRGGVREAELMFGNKTHRTFKITPQANSGAQQKALLDAWLK